ncbi:MAG: hypothetical protein WA624_08430 [Methylocella sp.]
MNAAIPAMLSYWDGLQWAPETRGGYEAIKALDTALSLALPYIEFPFGKYERKTHRHRPKDWHMAAIVIARIFIEAMIKSVGKTPSLERKSRLIVVVNEVMRRMNYKSVTDSAISRHLIRRIERSSGSMLPEVKKTTN